MNTPYEKLVKYTERLVEIVNKKYVSGETGANVAYLPILSGIGPYKVETLPGKGHNYYAVVDAIHNCYARNNDGGYDAGFRDGILALIRVSCAKVSSLDLLIDIVFYQLDKQNEGFAQFSVDIDEIVGLINTLIRDNKDNYIADTVSFGPWLEKVKKYALENYGLEIG